MDEPTSPRPYSRVRFRFDIVPFEDRGLYPFTENGVYVYFAEIPNMPVTAWWRIIGLGEYIPAIASGVSRN